MKLNVSVAIGVNQHNYSLVGKTLASPGNNLTQNHKLLVQNPIKPYTLGIICVYLAPLCHYSSPKETEEQRG